MHCFPLSETSCKDLFIFFYIFFLVTLDNRAVAPTLAVVDVIDAHVDLSTRLPSVTPRQSTADWLSGCPEGRAR